MPVDAHEVGVFEAARARSEAIAYRLLGSANDAEDAVQDPFLRWQSAGRTLIETHRGQSETRFPANAKVVSGDLFGPQWLETALEGVEAMRISPRATDPGLDELLKLAVEQGVKRVVLLSATTVERPAGEARFAASSSQPKTSSPDRVWSGRSCAWPTSPPTHWPGCRSSRQETWCAARTAEPPLPIHETDIAAVAVQALHGNVPTEPVCTLTGPQSLDQHEKVRLIGAAIDRTLSFQEIPPEQVRRGMLVQGLPEEVPSRLLGSLAD